MEAEREGEGKEGRGKGGKEEGARQGPGAQRVPEASTCRGGGETLQGRLHPAKAKITKEETK